MSKKRSPTQVGDNFLRKLKELQKRIRMKTGNDRSIRALTEDFAMTDAFEQIERKLTNPNGINVDFEIRFDRRDKHG